MKSKKNYNTKLDLLKKRYDEEIQESVKLKESGKIEESENWLQIAFATQLQIDKLKKRHNDSK